MFMFLMEKKTRKYNRKEDALQASAGQTTASRGGGSGRGKKKRGASAAGDRGALTVVASNPFDDEAPIVATNLHQIHLEPPHPQHPHNDPLHHSGPPPHHMMPSRVPPQGYAPPPPMSQMSPGLGPIQSMQPPLPPQHMATPPHHLDNHHMHPSGPLISSSPPSGRHPMYGGPPMHPMGPPSGMAPSHHQQLSGTPPPGAQLYCAECRNPIYPQQPRILCRAGCEAYYHRDCSGLTEFACQLLQSEPAAEWACNRCIQSDRQIPVFRVPNQHQNVDFRQPLWS